MNINPYDAPKDATDEEMRLAHVGRSDCPVCATTQQRYCFMNQWHKCRACGSSLQLKSPGWIRAVFFVGAVAGYWIASAYGSKFFFNSSELPTYYLIFCGVLFQVTPLAIGRIHVKPAESKPEFSGGFVLKSVAWFLLFCWNRVLCHDCSFDHANCDCRLFLCRDFFGVHAIGR